MNLDIIFSMKVNVGCLLVGCNGEYWKYSVEETWLFCRFCVLPMKNFLCRFVVSAQRVGACWNCSKLVEMTDCLIGFRENTLFTLQLWYVKCSLRSDENGKSFLLISNNKQIHTYIRSTNNKTLHFTSVLIITSSVQIVFFPWTTFLFSSPVRYGF